MSAKWFCAITTPHGAKLVEGELGARGYDVFAPKTRVWVRHARQLKASVRPLLGRYVFIEVDLRRQSFAPIYAARSVDSMLSIDGRPVPIPNREIKKLRWRCIRGEFDEVTNDKLPVGARVQVVAGEWEERLAVITGMASRKVATLKISGVREPVNLSEKSLRPV